MKADTVTEDSDYFGFKTDDDDKFALKPRTGIDIIDVFGFSFKDDTDTDNTIDFELDTYDDIGTVKADVETESTTSEIKATDAETESSNAETESSNTETESFNAETESSNAETESTPDEAAAITTTIDPSARMILVPTTFSKIGPFGVKITDNTVNLCDCR